MFITCEADSKVATAIALGLPMGYIVVFMVMSTVMSYLVRKLPTNFQVSYFYSLIIFFLPPAQVMSSGSSLCMTMTEKGESLFPFSI